MTLSVRARLAVPALRGLLVPALAALALALAACGDDDGAAGDPDAGPPPGEAGVARARRKGICPAGQAKLRRRADAQRVAHAEHQARRPPLVAARAILERGARR